jgi:pimeloyl-ACP methyl ester carboxylesterase
LDQYFRRVRLRLVDGAGHFAPLEYPAVLAEEVRAVLASTA